MSVMALFGVAVVCGLLVLVALFMAALYLGAGAAAGDDYADSEAIDASFSSHGVHIG